MRPRTSIMEVLARTFLAGLLTLGGWGAKAAPAVTQFYSDFDDGLPAGTQVRSNAAWGATGGVGGSGVLKLTEAVTNQIGSFIVEDFANGAEITRFWIRFQVRVGGGTGADGFSFNVGPDLPAEPFGEEGAGGWLRISFDTFRNQGEEAPDITLGLGGLPAAQRGFPLRTDQDFVPVEVLVTRLGGPPPVASIFTRFEVHYRQTNVISHTIPSWFSFPTGTLYGLGARTGGATDNHWIDNLLILANYTPGPPTIVASPTNTTARFGERTRLLVVADGTPPLNYQWLRNNVEIPGATEPVYTTPPMDFSQDGARYSVRVWNGQNTDASPAAMVALDPLTTYAWPLARGFNLIATPIETLDGAGGAIGGLWRTAPHGATFWKFDNDRQAWREAEVFVAGQGWRPGTTRLSAGEGGWFYSPEAFSLVATGRVVQRGLPPGPGGPDLLLRGSPVPAPARYSQMFSTPPADDSKAHLWDSNSQAFDSLNYEFGQWNRDWVAGPGEGVFLRGPVAEPVPATPNAPPTISPIADRTIFLGQSLGPISFRVLDADHPADVLGVTASSSNTGLLPQANIVLDGAGENRVLTLIPAAGAFGRTVVTVTGSDPPGASSSTQFTLRVASTNGPPVFVLDPTPADFVPGQTVRLEAEADGAAPIAYLWRRNGALLRHETNRVLVIPNAQPENGGTYSAVAFNALGAATSDRAVVRAVAPSTVALEDSINDAQAASNEAGQSLRSSREASREPGEPQHAGKPGGRSLWFRWQPARGGIATFDTLGSSFDTLLAVYEDDPFAGLREVVSDDDGGGYFNGRVRFNAEAGVGYLIAVDGFYGEAGDVALKWGLQTGPGRLPMIRSHPAGVAVPPRTRVRFAVEADDPATQELRYQWVHNGAGILPGETNSVLVITQANGGHLGTYRVEVIRGAVTNTSRDAVLELTSSPGPPTFDKLEDAAAIASNGDQPLVHGRPRLASSGSLTVGTPGSRLILNNSGDTQAWEDFGCGIVIGRSRWIPVAVPADGTLVVDTFGSAVDTQAQLFRWNGDFGTDPVLIACSDEAAPGSSWRLLVATNIPAGTDYYLTVDRPLTGATVDAADGPVHFNWTFRYANPGREPALFTEGDVRDGLTLARGLVTPWNELLTNLAARVTASDLTALRGWLAATNGTPEDATEMLLAILNAWVGDGPIWDARAFAGIQLDPQLAQQVISPPAARSPEERRFNRLLLEAAFPNELQGSREPRLRIWESLAPDGAVHFRLVDAPPQAWRVEEAVSLPDSPAASGWLQVSDPAVTGQLDPSLWLKIIGLPAGNAGGHRFFRVVR